MPPWLAVAVACWMASGDASARSQMPVALLVALEHRGAASFGGEASRCAFDAASRDLISGVVRFLHDGDGGDVYEGILQRISDQALCGRPVEERKANRAPAVEPCRTTLSGAGDVRVRIKLPPTGTGRRDAWVVVTPIDVLATVTGNCSAAERREMQKTYSERITVEIPLPPGPLAPGRYPERAPQGRDSHWVLTVRSPDAANPPGVPLVRPLHVDEQVVVTARLDRAGMSPLPRTVSVLDEDEIVRRQARTTPEALEAMPGVFVQKTNHGAGSPVIRGLMGNQVLVLVDGIRLNNATFRYGPNQYLATVDVFGIERLEVVRGPGSVEFGSDAMGGVVNVLTKAPQLSASGTRVAGSATARIVSDGMEQSGRGEAEYATPRLAVRGGVTARRFGDLRAGGTLGVEAPSGYDEFAGDARLLWQASGTTTVAAGWQWLHQDDVPRFDQVSQRGFSRWSFAPQARQLAWGRVTHSLPVAWMSSMSLTGSWQGSLERRERQARGSPIFITEEDRIRSLGLLAEATARPIGGLAIRYGLDLYHDDVASTRRDRNVDSSVVSTRRGLYPDGATAKSAELFAVGAWTKGRMTLDGGARQTWGRVAAEDASFGDVDLATSATTGSLGAGWMLGGGVEIYGSAAQAFRAPNIDDTSTLGAFDFGVEAPAADLVPERSLSLEGGVRLRRQRLAVAAAVWRTSLSELVDRVRSTYVGLETWEGQPVYRRANVGDATLRGLEVEGRASLGEPFEVGGFIAYAYGQQQASGQPMRRVPPLNGQLTLRWRHRRADAEASWRAAAEQDRLASGDRDDHRIAPGGTPEWHAFDVRGGYALTPRLQAVARFGNVFNRAYRIHGSGIDGVGRHLSVSLRVGPR